MNFEQEHIDENLVNKCEGGFLVPAGYFEAMQKDILRKTSENGFKVPDGYFETVDRRVQQKLRKAKVIQLEITNFKKIALGIAASVLLVSGFFILKNKFETAAMTNSYAEGKWNELSDEDIINYIDVADIKDLHVTELTIKTEDNMQKQLEDYLLNNTDEPIINEEL